MQLRGFQTTVDQSVQPVPPRSLPAFIRYQRTSSCFYWPLHRLYLCSAPKSATCRWQKQPSRPFSAYLPNLWHAPAHCSVLISNNLLCPPCPSFIRGEWLYKNEIHSSPILSASPSFNINFNQFRRLDDPPHCRKQPNLHLIGARTTSFCITADLDHVNSLSSPFASLVPKF